MNVHAKTQIPLLELDLLKTLVAIAETGNFSAAAEAVFRTPSAISMQVKKIEELVGRQVFLRDSRSVSLTADGELLLEHARRILALNRDMITQFITPEVVGEVKLGAVDYAAEQFLPAVLKRFYETHPAVVVDVIVENSAELADRIRASQLDIAMVTCDSANYSGLPVETLYREQLAWAGLKGGVAVEQTPLPVSVWEEGCVWRKAALEGLFEDGRDYRITFKSAYVSGQKAAILADLAIAPLPVSFCEGKITDIGKAYDLPKLSKFSLGMLIAPNAPEAVQAVADHLRASFVNK